MSQPNVDDAYQSAIDFLYDRLNYERLASETARYPFRLKRTDELMRRLGLADYLVSETRQPKVPIVHIAGTKGKGSTATMVAAAMTSAGLKTGLYTSPHLQQLEERFRIDGQICSPNEFVEVVSCLEPIVKQLESESGVTPSFFELTTCMAMIHFDRNDCDAIVLEVGLGGRLDSTNVCAPTVTAITSIGLDHQHVLGDTLSEIAGEKAGIIKSKIPIVSGVANGEASVVIAERAAENEAPLFKLGQDFLFDYEPGSEWGGTIAYSGRTPPVAEDFSIKLSLEGEHQAHNASIAIAILQLLCDQGVSIEHTQAHKGIESLSFDGRIEKFETSSGVTIIVDAAHNADSMGALCKCVQSRFESRETAFVFGTSRDKNAGTMLDQISAVADSIVLTKYKGNPRFAEPTNLLEQLPEPASAKSIVVELPIDACEAAFASVAPSKGVVVICGSFFLAAETRSWAKSK